MANRIKELRDQRGMTLEQVAEGADTTFQQIQRLEQGKRRLTDDWMRRVAKALGCSAAELLAVNPVPNSAEVPQKLEHFMLIRWWDGLDLTEKRLIAAAARDKGVELLSDEPQKRRRRRR